MRSNSACSTGTDFSPAGPAEPKKPRLKEYSVPYSKSPNIGYNRGIRWKRRTGIRAMRAIGLVLLSIMALLLTDADAQRRSSAQGEPGGGGQRKLVRDLSQSGPQRQLQLFLVRPVLGDGPGTRRLLPTQSVSGHGIRDRLHLGVRSVTLDCRQAPQLSLCRGARRLFMTARRLRVVK